MLGNKVIFIVLFSVLALIAAHGFSLFGVPGQDAYRSDRGQKVPRLMLDLLDKQRPEFKAVRRDIFSLPQPPRPKAVKTPEPSYAEPVPVEPPPPSELQVFTSEASYIGLLSRQAVRTVFINSGSEVLTVRKGDVISTRFRVVEITDNELLLKDDSTGEEASITLRGAGRTD